MDPFERYSATVQGAVDSAVSAPRIPLLMRFAARHVGCSYGAFVSDHRVLVEAGRRCAIDFDLDHLATISDPYRETEAFGGRVHIDSELGPQQQAVPLAARVDPDTLAIPDPLQHPRMADRLAAIRLYAQDRPRRSVLGWIEGPAALAADLRGISEFLMDLIDDAGWASALMDRCLETAIRFARAQIEAGADTIGIGDAIASQVSPLCYETLIVPRERALVDAVHAAGAWARLHICGDISRHLPAMAAVGADIVDCDHQVCLRTAHRILPDTVLAGNLDPVSQIEHGSPAAIADAIVACRDACDGRYAIAGGCEITPGTSIRNLRSMCSALCAH